VHPPLIAALLDPARYPHACGTVELVETHISWVLLAGDFAYKIKKPVALGFLDFSTLEARHRCCEEELRLNRRTAPGLYLDVVAIGGTPQAPAVGAGGAAIEYAVKMRRFDEAGLLDRLARNGALGAEILDRLAESIAAFHAGAAVAGAGAPFGDLRSVRDPALANFAHVAQLGPPAQDTGRLDRLRDWTAAELARLERALAARKAGGFVRECHGDLHLGNVALVDGAPTAFDCIEFNAALRWIDVMSEVAFLVMDLLDHGLEALAWRALNRYLEATGDYGGVPVLRFYLAYRAMVRAKVALIRARQGDAAPGAQREAGAAFERHLWLAERLARPAPAALVLMHGVSGSGKSWTGQRLLEATGALRVRSDLERKRLHGVAATGTSGSAVGGGIYGAEATQRTYERLAAVAAESLRAGWSVVVDAAFLRRAERDAFLALARSLGAPFALISCQAPPQVLRARIAARAAAGTDPSEADAAVLEHQLATEEHLGEDELAAALVVRDGDPDPGSLAARLAALLDAQA